MKQKTHQGLPKGCELTEEQLREVKGASGAVLDPNGGFSRSLSGEVDPASD